MKIYFDAWRSMPTNYKVVGAAIWAAFMLACVALCCEHSVMLHAWGIMLGACSTAACVMAPAIVKGGSDDE